jgi:hypothetical protein
MQYIVAITSVMNIFVDNFNVTPQNLVYDLHKMNEHNMLFHIVGLDTGCI